MDSPGVGFGILLTGEKGSILMGEGFGETIQTGDREDWESCVGLSPFLV